VVSKIPGPPPPFFHNLIRNTPALPYKNIVQGSGLHNPLRKMTITTK
jgi:hypothetical protein